MLRKNRSQSSSDYVLKKLFLFYFNLFCKINFASAEKCENPQINNVAATALWLSGNLVFAKEIYKSVYKLFIVFAREEKNLPFVYLTCLRSVVSPCGHIACVITYVTHCSKFIFI